MRYADALDELRHHPACKATTAGWKCIPYCGQYTAGQAPDRVNHPAHYVAGRTMEPVEVILDWDLSYCLGQVVKYVARCGRKFDAVEDLRKARFYLDREIRRLEAGR